MSDRDNVADWFEYGLLESQRTILLETETAIGATEFAEKSEVTDSMAIRFVKAMSILEARSKDPITVILHTVGGCEFAMFTIYDRIKESPCHVTVRGYGQIFSAGSVIIQAADERQMSANSYLMIHRGENGVQGSSETIQSWGDAYDRINKRMYEIYYEGMNHKDPKITIKKIENLCKDDVVYDAEQALEVGLIDNIYTGKQEDR